MNTAARIAAATGTTILGAALASCAAGPDSTSSRAPSSPTPTAGATPPAVAQDYRDGRYSATGWYGSLPSHQDVTVTIEDDIVTDVEITTPAEDPISLQHQEEFAAALPGEIVGRDLDTIVVDRLAGASGCSEGFMDALAQIRTAALLPG